jgi:hypothetical protein
MKHYVGECCQSVLPYGQRKQILREVGTCGELTRCMFLASALTRRGAGCVLCARSAGCSQKRLARSFQGCNRIRNLCLPLWSSNQTAVLSLEQSVRFIAEKACVEHKYVEPFIKQVETLLPQGGSFNVSRDRVGRTMTERGRTDCFTTTVGRGTLHFYCSNFWHLKIQPSPPILPTASMLRVITSCFQECSCSYGHTVSSMFLKFRNIRLPTCARLKAINSSGSGRNFEPIAFIW